MTRKKPSQAAKVARTAKKAAAKKGGVTRRPKKRAPTAIEAMDRKFAASPFVGNDGVHNPGDPAPDGPTAFSAESGYQVGAGNEPPDEDDGN